MRKLEVLYDKGCIYLKCRDMVDIFDCDVAAEEGAENCEFREGEWCKLGIPLEVAVKDEA